MIDLKKLSKISDAELQDLTSEFQRLMDEYNVIIMVTETQDHKIHCVVVNADTSIDEGIFTSRWESCNIDGELANELKPILYRLYDND